MTAARAESLRLVRRALVVRGGEPDRSGAHWDEEVRMFHEAIWRTAALLREPQWWAPLVRPACVRCGERVAATESRVIDGRGRAVSVTHVSCLTSAALRADVGLPRAEEPRARPRWPMGSAADRCGALQAHAAELRRTSVGVRQYAHHALDEIHTLLGMLRATSAVSTPDASGASPPHAASGSPRTS